MSICTPWKPSTAFHFYHGTGVMMRRAKVSLFIFNILIILNPTPTQAQFLSQISSLSTVISNDVAVDASGNSYITGGFVGTANLEGVSNTVTLTSLGLKDIFVAKYDPQGQPLWAFSMGGVAAGPGVDDEGLSIEVSPAGNVFVTGYFQGAANFDPDGVAELTSRGFRDVFVASYTADGQFRWAESFGGTADDRGQDVGIHNNDAVYFTGLFRETALLSSDSGGANAVTSAGEEDGYLISMDQDAGLNWIFRYGDGSVDKGSRVDTDAAGNVYLTGIFSRDADFDPGDGNFTLSSLSGSQDGVLATFTPAGALRWAIPIGSAQLDGVTGLAVDSAGHVFITGHFIGTLNFDPLNTPDERVSLGIDQYIASYSPTGSLAWVYVLGSGFAQGSDIAVNNLGQILVSGVFSDGILPDPQSALQRTSHGQQDMLLASYSADGSFRWAHAIGGTLSEIPTGVALGNAGEAYLTGLFEDEVDFNPGANNLLASSAGAYDGFLVRYALDGSFPVAIEDNALPVTDNFEIEVYPNPAVDRVAVEITSYQNKSIKLTLLDVLGRQVITTEVQLFSGTKTSVSLDISDLLPGLYFVRIQGSGTAVGQITVVQ